LTRIVAIGGAVVKTAFDEIKEVARRKLFNVLIHNGGSIFHDFQMTTEKDKLPGYSYHLEQILKNPELNKPASELVWSWVISSSAPEESLTWICQENDIDVLMFTGLATDFWQIGKGYIWDEIAARAFRDFDSLCWYMQNPFHYICMGSAVIHPEVFTKALSVVKPKEFTADVVDFLNMYRPRTRVAKYGTYYRMTHKGYLRNWLEKEESSESVQERRDKAPLR